MKIRVYVANGNDWREAHIEIDCEGQPRAGEFFCITWEMEKQLMRKILADHATFEYFWQWIIRRRDNYSLLNIDDASVVYEVSWFYDKKMESMMCYVALDANKKGEGVCYSEDWDVRQDLTYDEYLSIKENTEKQYEL